jgi:hypothetical protein
VVQGQPGQIVQETRFSRCGGVAQAEENLLCKHKALSSSSSPAERERESTAYVEHFGRESNKHLRIINVIF